MTRISAGDVQLDYETRGRGAPLLLLNGFRRNRAAWMEPFLAEMERHFLLVLLDNRGTGQSDKPPAGQYSIEQFADDAAGVLAALGIPRAHVFGVSMGGMIAQRLSIRHPERVRGLVIGCSHCGKSGLVPATQEVRDLLRLTPKPGLTAREVARRQEAIYVTDDFRAQHQDVLAEFYKRVNIHPTPPHAVQGHLQALEAFEGCAELEAIAHPTLVITGSEDRLFPPENSRRLAAGIPGAELVLLPRAAHFFWIETPEETARHLREFFARLD